MTRAKSWRMSAERASAVTISEIDADTTAATRTLRPSASSENAVRQARLQIVIATPADFCSITITPAAAFDLLCALVGYFEGADLDAEDETEGDEIA